MNLTLITCIDLTLNDIHLPPRDYLLMGPKNFPSKAQPRENGLPYKGICVVPLLVTIIYNESLLPNIKQNICPKHDILSINVGYFQNRVFFFSLKWPLLLLKFMEKAPIKLCTAH